MEWSTWDANWAFQEILRSRAKEGIKAKKVKKESHSYFDDSKFPPLNNPEEPTPLNTDEVASVLEYGGPFSQFFESFEQRPEQIGMIRAVTEALSYGSHLMVEAATGVGKSYAYLIPSALFALQNNTTRCRIHKHDQPARSTRATRPAQFESGVES